jgi:hypothetical protein
MSKQIKKYAKVPRTEENLIKWKNERLVRLANMSNKWIIEYEWVSIQLLDRWLYSIQAIVFKTSGDPLMLISSLLAVIKVFSVGGHEGWGWNQGEKGVSSGLGRNHNLYI